MYVCIVGENGCVCKVYGEFEWDTNEHALFECVNNNDDIY